MVYKWLHNKHKQLTNHAFTCVWDIWHILYSGMVYHIAGNFWRRKLREFRSFVAIYKSFLHKYLGAWHLLVAPVSNQWKFSLRKFVFFTNSQIAKAMLFGEPSLLVCQYTTRGCCSWKKFNLNIKRKNFANIWKFAKLKAKKLSTLHGMCRSVCSTCYEEKPRRHPLKDQTVRTLEERHKF